MQDQDPNQKHYFNPIETPSSQLEHLSKFQEEQVFTLWEEGKSDKNTEEFTFLKFEKESMTIVLKSNGGLFDKIKGSSLQNKTVLFRTSKGNLKYFSKGPLKHDETKSQYHLTVEPPIYVAQQRSDYRLEVDPKLISIKLLWQGIDLQVNDISAGGMSLKLPKDQASILSDKEYIEECILHFKTIKFNIPSIKILKVWTQKGAEGQADQICYGMKFKGVASRQEDRLAQMIAMEARGKEIRKILDDKKNKTK